MLIGAELYLVEPANQPPGESPCMRLGLWRFAAFRYSAEQSALFNSSFSLYREIAGVGITVFVFSVRHDRFPAIALPVTAGNFLYIAGSNSP